jgi:hypothetical protein
MSLQFHCEIAAEWPAATTMARGFLFQLISMHMFTKCLHQELKKAQRYGLWVIQSINLPTQSKGARLENIFVISPAGRFIDSPVRGE